MTKRSWRIITHAGIIIHERGWPGVQEEVVSELVLVPHFNTTACG